VSKVALIEYFTTRKNTFIFIVRPQDNKPIIEIANINEDQLKECRDNLLGNKKRSVIGSFQSIDPEDPNKTDLKYFYNLSEELIHKFLVHVKEYDTLYLIPHGWLHHLPLHALKCDDGRYLIENFKIVYSPSASVIKYCQLKNRDRRSNRDSEVKKSCLSFGVGKMDDPPFLKESFRKEAIYIGKEIFSSKGELKIDLEASKKYFIEHCKNKDVIHIACHGFFNKIEPLKSGLLLSDGNSLPNVKINKLGFPEISPNMLLTAEDIFNLKLTANVAVLSSCLTGVNEIRPGDELIGLTRSLIYAGVSSVIVSLWSVYSYSTLELIKTFFEYWLNTKDTISKAEAFQRAQIFLINNKLKAAWQHPYHWAPFILVGDWI